MGNWASTHEANKNNYEQTNAESRNSNFIQNVKDVAWNSAGSLNEIKNRFVTKLLLVSFNIYFSWSGSVKYRSSVQEIQNDRFVLVLLILLNTNLH